MAATNAVLLVKAGIVVTVLQHKVYRGTDGQVLSQVGEEVQNVGILIQRNSREDIFRRHRLMSTEATDRM